MRQLASIAGALDATEGQIRLRRRRVIDPDHSALDLIGHGSRPLGVTAEHRAVEPVGRRVRQRDRLGIVLDPVDDSDQSEEFLRVRTHLRCHTGENGGLHECAGPVDPFAAGDGPARWCGTPSNRLSSCTRSSRFDSGTQAVSLTRCRASYLGPTEIRTETTQTSGVAPKRIRAGQAVGRLDRMVAAYRAALRSPRIRLLLEMVGSLGWSIVRSDGS